jgi:hypothetical protein
MDSYKNQNVWTYETPVEKTREGLKAFSTFGKAILKYGNASLFRTHHPLPF